MYKRIIALVAVALLLLSISAAGFCAGENDTEADYRMQPIQDKLSGMTESDVETCLKAYSDVKTHWSRQYVGKLSGLEIISGNGDGTFKPNDPLQADQFIKMVVRSLGYKIAEGKPYWATPYIDMAKSIGLILEKEITDYKKPITRENMLRIIVRASNKTSAVSDRKYDKYVIGRLPDYPKISDSCKQSAVQAFELGLVTGDLAGKINPKSGLTRAEASTVIIRFLDKNERKPMVPGPNEIMKIEKNNGEMTEIYPGLVPETFYVAKAAQAAIPKAEGYVAIVYNPENGIIAVLMYNDEASFKQNVLNMKAEIEIGYDNVDSQKSYAYNLWIDDNETYKKLFEEYVNEVFKTIFAKDSSKAVELHKKYLDMKYTRADGLNQYTEAKLNNRSADFILHSDTRLSIQIKLIGSK